MSWIPLAVVIGFFVGRLWELRHRFPATPGHIKAPATFRVLTLVGSATVASAVLEYLLTGMSYSWLLLIVGVGLGVSAFWLRALSRKALAEMWSVDIEIRRGHRLVRHGPYRFVRHPIYIAAILELCAAPVVLSAWRTAAVFIPIYLVALAWRVRVEEREMEAELGESWRDYCASTGAIFPRL